MDTAFRARVRQIAWLGFIVAYVTAFVGGVVGVSTFPSAGVDYEVVGNEVVITDFEPGSHLWIKGARIGDVVEELNDAPAIEVLDSEERIEYVTFRPAASGTGENLTRLALLESRTGLIDETVGLNIVGLAFAVMAVLIYLRATRSTDTVLFAFMAMSAAIACAIGPASVANHPWGRVALGPAVNVASVMFFAFFLGFTRFTRRADASGGSASQSGSFKAWMPEIWLLISSALIVPWVLTATSVADMFAILRPGMLVVLALSLVGGVFLLGYSLRTADRENQERLRIVTLGTVIALIPFVWLSLIPLLVTGTEIVRGDISVISFILIPVTFGYAIARHDLLGIRRLFHRGAAYAIITAAIIVVYGSILTVLDLLAPDSESLGPIQGAIFVLMFAGAPAISSVRRVALRIVDRVIYEGAVTTDDLVSAISTVSANETDAESTLARALSFTGQGFDVEYAVMVSYDGTDNDQPASADHVYNNPGADVINRAASIGPGESRRAYRALLPGTDQTVLVSTFRVVRGKTRSIVLGPKVSEEVFTDEDIELLNTVCAVISTALTRIRLLDEVEEQNTQLRNMGTEMQNIQELERQELSAYLHDEPLQKLAFLNSRMREMEIDDQLKLLMDEVVRDLRSASANLSPEMLRNHGLMSALKWAVESQQERGPFKVFLEINGIAQDERFSDEIELAIYRATQEALNNCRKHAQAKSVWVKLSKDDSQIELSVQDNGVGIEVSKAAQGERSPDQGMGHGNLKQRITSLGGALAIRPRPSRGTELHAVIPLTAMEQKAS